MGHAARYVRALITEIRHDVVAHPLGSVVSTCGNPEKLRENHSLLAVKLRNWLFAKAAADMSIFIMLQSESLVTLAEKVVTKGAHVREAGLVPAK